MPLELDYPEAVKLTETNGAIAFTLVIPTLPLEVQTSKIESYRKDARAILDTASFELNKIGIEGLIAALIIETRGLGYYGTDNS